MSADGAAGCGTNPCLALLRAAQAQQVALQTVDAAESSCLAPGSWCVHVQAPMVRYSKLEFRLLTKSYGVDISYTPMIVASTFIESQLSRDVELTRLAGPSGVSGIPPDDRPLVVQFAASSAKEFVAAGQLVAGHCDAIELNCGCPQRWAMGSGFGAKLIYQQDHLVDMIRITAAQAGLPVAVKMRVHDDLRETVDLARRLEAAGVAWLTVHGRTFKQGPSSPVDLEAIKMVREHVSIPLVANGDVCSLDQAHEVAERTGACGVMAARGLLTNPALFAGHDQTPVEAIRRFYKLSVALGSKFTLARYHLVAMAADLLTRGEKSALMRMQSLGQISDFFRHRVNVDLDAAASNTPSG